MDCQAILPAVYLQARRPKTIRTLQPSEVSFVFALIPFLRSSFVQLIQIFIRRHNDNQIAAVECMHRMMNEYITQSRRWSYRFTRKFLRSIAGVSARRNWRLEWRGSPIDSYHGLRVVRCGTRSVFGTVFYNESTWQMTGSTLIARAVIAVVFVCVRVNGMLMTWTVGGDYS